MWAKKSKKRYYDAKNQVYALIFIDSPLSKKFSWPIFHSLHFGQTRSIIQRLIQYNCQINFNILQEAQGHLVQERKEFYKKEKIINPLTRLNEFFYLHGLCEANVIPLIIHIKSFQQKKIKTIKKDSIYFPKATFAITRRVGVLTTQMDILSPLLSEKNKKLLSLEIQFHLTEEIAEIILPKIKSNKLKKGYRRAKSSLMRRIYLLRRLSVTFLSK